MEKGFENVSGMGRMKQNNKSQMTNYKKYIYVFIEQGEDMCFELITEGDPTK
jgi:hypothetical protein